MKKLSQIKELELVCTLLPVALPTSAYLSRFRIHKSAYPSYPSSLVDALRLEPGGFVNILSSS